MNLNKHGIQFLIDMKDNLSTVNIIIDFCRKKRLREDIQIRILASCFLGILYEILNYLDYIEEIIEKQFGKNFSSDSEWSNIRTLVFSESIDNVLKNAVPRIESIVVAVIDGWNAYDKLNENEMFEEFMKGAR